MCWAVSTSALAGTLLEQRLELSPSTKRGPSPRNDAGSKRFTQIGLVTTQKSEPTELFCLFIIFLVAFWQRNPERATKSEAPLPEVEQKRWNLSGLLELSQTPPKYSPLVLLLLLLQFVHPAFSKLRIYAQARNGNVRKIALK